MAEMMPAAAEPIGTQVGQLTRLGLMEAKTTLRNLDDLDAAITQLLRQTRRKHDKLKTQLQKPDCPVLSDTQVERLDEVQHDMAVLQSQKRELDTVRAALGDGVASAEAEAAKGRTWRQWLQSAPVQKTLAATEMAIAMLFKFGAWNGVEAILPGDAEAFGTPAQIAALITKRLLLSLAFAGAGEYIAGTDGPRRWVAAGGDLKTIMGFGQASDQGITLAGQFATNPASGQAAPSYGQIIGFALAGLGGVLQTGALNKPILGAIDYLRGGNDEPDDAFEFIDTEALKAAQRQQANGQPEQVEASEADLEQGRGPMTQNARGTTDESALIDDLWSNDVPSMKAEITRAFTSMSELHNALAPAAAQETEEAAALDVIREATGQALLQPAPPQDHEAQIAQFKRDLDAVLTAATEVRDSLPPNDELRAKIDTVFQDAKRMEEAVTEASKNLTPHETAFLWGMTGLGATGLLLTFIGPPTGNEWLSNVNNRAAIAGLTSSVGQNLANLGQFLGGAKPGDGRLKRFLKIGLDNEDDNQVVKFAKDWGRNVRFLPIEFLPLTIASTFAQMGSVLKGTIPEAPLRAIPSFTTDRLMMETLRMALTYSFMVFRLGHRLEWNHYAGLASTLAGAATAVATELRG